MIARHEGQVVLVLGGIPGERVRARVERVEKRLAFASAAEILTPSADRRAVIAGSALRRLRLRAHRLPAAGRAQVRGHRGRVHPDRPHSARVARRGGHLAGSRLPDARAPARRRRPAGLLPRGDAPAVRRGRRPDSCCPESLTAIEAALSALGAGARRTSRRSRSARTSRPTSARCTSSSSGRARLPTGRSSTAVAAAGLTGCTARSANGAFATAGSPAVADPLAALTAGRATGGELRRHAVSFFQGNRFLIADLVGAVMDAVPPDGAVLDLYAGVGLFSVSLAAAGRGADHGGRRRPRERRRSPAERRAVLDRSFRPIVGPRGGARARAARPRAPSSWIRRGPACRREAMDAIVQLEAVAARLRLVRSADDGAGCAAAARRGLPPRVAAGVRSVPEHAARGDRGGIRAGAEATERTEQTDPASADRL